MSLLTIQKPRQERGENADGDCCLTETCAQLMIVKDKCVSELHCMLQIQLRLTHFIY